MLRLDFSSAEQFAGHQATGDVFFQLGVMYATGRTVPMDLVTAHKWFNLAAHRGNAEAVRARKEITEEMTKDEVADALRAAREWLTTH